MSDMELRLIQVCRKVSMQEGKPMQICGRGDHVPEANAMDTKMTVRMNGQVQVALSQQPAPPT